ncbi:MAG TPA: RNA-binding cell elongation regulator Jag/EloR [Candidatus Xenobia bacterium]|jgi:spoIIIJ-associated protein
MQVIEEYGRTVEEAVQKALGQLGVGEDKVTVDVIDPGRKATSSGFGAKFARVKVTLKDGAGPMPAARRAPPEVEEEAEEEEDGPDEEERPVERAAVEERREEGGPRRGRRRRGRGGDRGEERAPEREEWRAETPRPAPAEGEEDEEETPAFRPVRPESPDADAAEDVLKEVLRLMGVEAEVERDYDRENAVRFNVVGDDLGALIGKYGQTIEAVQYLVNLIASRQNETYEKVSIDIEGYRDRRERSLEELATRMARKVRNEGKSVTLEPMLPSERRIIHMALSDDAGVRTYSQGEEPMRKVVISPARGGRSR